MGDNDEYIKEEQVYDYEELLNNSNIDFKLIRFEGKHDIPENVLLEQPELSNW
jgi:hypothetical protein